jgi:hypothetical protein
MTIHVSREQKSNLYRRLCQAGLSTSQIDEERSAIVRRLRKAGISSRAERQANMWSELAATHLGCDLDGNPLSGQGSAVDGVDGDVEECVDPGRRPNPQVDWPFAISRSDAAEEIAEGTGRTSSYAKRIAWVSQHLDMPTATPRKAPCNAAWSMLAWAVNSRKEFYSQERQLMSRREPERPEETAIDVAPKRIADVISRFSCWRRLEEDVRSGKLVLHESKRRQR